MKYILTLLTLVISIYSTSQESKSSLTVDCIEKSIITSQSDDDILVRTCVLNNHLFKSTGMADYKGRYSYKYEVFQIADSDTLIVNNSNFFSRNTIELERLVNDKFRSEYESNYQIPEISDCMEWIDFRYYKLNEFGIYFNEENRIEFSINFGIGSACFNVNSSSIAMELYELERYLN